MKICVINILPKNAELHKNALMQSFKMVASPGTEVVYKDTKGGTVYLPYHRYSYTRLLNGKELIESMLEAKSESCDGIVYD